MDITWNNRYKPDGNCQNIHMGNHFVYKNPKAQELKEQIDKWDYITLRSAA